MQAHTVCCLWSFHSSLASKTLKTVLTWHPTLQWVVPQNNKSSNKLRARRARWRRPWSVTSKLCDACPHHTWQKKMPFFLYFWLRRWSKIVHHATLPSPQISHSSHSCFFLLYFAKKQRCGACQTAGHPALPITEGQEHVEKQPILDLQYLGKLCSICQPTSPSVADIWQKSLKAHYWQRDKAGEKNAPQIILKSQGTSSSAYICLTGI